MYKIDTIKKITGNIYTTKVIVRANSLEKVLLYKTINNGLEPDIITNGSIIVASRNVTAKEIAKVSERFKETKIFFTLVINFPICEFNKNIRIKNIPKDNRLIPTLLFLSILLKHIVKIDIINIINSKINR